MFVYLSDCNLLYLPLDLEEILKKKLDARYERQRSYGWKKVGEAFQNPTDDLKYLARNIPLFKYYSSTVLVALLSTFVIIAVLVKRKQT